MCRQRADPLIAGCMAHRTWPVSCKSTISPLWSRPGRWSSSWGLCSFSCGGRTRKAGWLGWLAVPYFLGAGAVVFIAPRGQIPNILTMGAGTALMLLALGAFWVGARVFERRKAMLWPPVLAAADGWRCSRCPGFDQGHVLWLRVAMASLLVGDLHVPGRLGVLARAARKSCRRAGRRLSFISPGACFSRFAWRRWDGCRFRWAGNISIRWRRRRSTSSLSCMCCSSPC